MQTKEKYELIFAGGMVFIGTGMIASFLYDYPQQGWILFGALSMLTIVRYFILRKFD